MFSTKPVYSLLILSVSVTCPAQLIILNHVKSTYRKFQQNLNKSEASGHNFMSFCRSLQDIKLLTSRSRGSSSYRACHWTQGSRVETRRPRFNPRERTPGTHWTGSWVGPGDGLDPEIIFPLPGIEPRLPDRPVRS
jgi:hypothetical protein